MNSDDGTGMTSCLDRWSRADDVYYEAIVLSSLCVDSDTSPYNVAILPQRIDGVVSTVCGNVTSADPYFLFKNPGQTATALEGVQQTVTYALDIARFDRRIREAAKEAAKKGRGFLRLRYATFNTTMLADWEDVDTMVDNTGADPDSNPEGEVEASVGGGDVRYSGLVIDSFTPEDAVTYPTWATAIVDMTMIGNRFTQRHLDIITKQENGRYFDDAVISLSNDSDDSMDSVISDPNDYGQLCYDVLVKCKPDVEGAPGQKGQPEAWYRATILYNNRELLALEPYDLPTPWYFAPTLEGDIKRFWPRRALADRLIEIQTLYNDAWTLIILASVATSIQTVMVTGPFASMETQAVGLRQFLTSRGATQFTPIPGAFNADGLTWIIENLERVADAIARFSQLGLGGELRGDATATEANGLMQGQQAGSEDYTAEFGLELERMADLSRFLLFINWDAFYEFHGNAITLEKPSDLTMRCQCELNGVRPADTQQASIAKINTLIETLQKLGIQVSPSTRQVNIDAVADTFLGSLNMQSSTANILQEIQPQEGIPNDPNAIPGQAQPAGAVAPPQAGPGSFGPPPALLHQLVTSLQAKMAAGAAVNGAPAASGGPGPNQSPGPMGGPG